MLQQGTLAKIRVLIVEDHRLFADALVAALSDEGISVIDITTTGREGLSAAVRLRPDLVLLDLGLPDVNGLEVGKEIVAQLPETKVVILTGLRHPEWASEAMRSGLHGFLTKESGLSQLVSAIAAVASGQAVLSGPVAATMAGATSPEEKYWTLLANQLTEREREILAMLVEGAGSGDIARRAGIMPNTVRTHIQNLLSKLQVHSRLEAAALATRAGLLRPRGPTSL